MTPRKKGVVKEFELNPPCCGQWMVKATPSGKGDQRHILVEH